MSTLFHLFRLQHFYDCLSLSVSQCHFVSLSFSPSLSPVRALSIFLPPSIVFIYLSVYSPVCLSMVSTFLSLFRCLLFLCHIHVYISLSISLPLVSLSYTSNGIFLITISISFPTSLSIS